MIKKNLTREILDSSSGMYFQIVCNVAQEFQKNLRVIVLATLV